MQQRKINADLGITPCGPIIAYRVPRPTAELVSLSPQGCLAAGVLVLSWGAL